MDARAGRLDAEYVTPPLLDVAALLAVLFPLGVGCNLPAGWAHTRPAGAQACPPAPCRRIYVTAFIWGALVDCVLVKGQEPIGPEARVVQLVLLFCVHR